MKIGVNTRLLLKGKLEGIGRFSYEVLKRITSQNPDIQFFFYFDRPYDPEFIFSENITAKSVFPQARHPFLYWLWFEWALPYHFQKDKIDIFFSPDGFLSLNTKVPQVPVIHDLAFEHLPEGISKIGAWYYKRYMPKFANIAKKIVTVSEFTKQDIVRRYHIDPSRIVVSCNGVSPIFKQYTIENQNFIKKKYTNGAPFLLYVGSIHPRKNLERLLQAFEKIKKEQENDLKLLIVGRKAWNFGDVIKFYEQMKYQNDVVFTGRIDDEELAQVYSAAEILCYVSLFEGFGIPILEAFAAGIPVVASNTSSMPEIGGNAAVYVNPYDINSISKGILSILQNNSYKKQLLKNSLEVLKKFTWQQAADQVKKSLFGN